MKTKRRCLAPLLSEEEFRAALREFAKKHPGIPVYYQDPARQALANQVLESTKGARK